MGTAAQDTHQKPFHLVTSMYPRPLFLKGVGMLKQHKLLLATAVMAFTQFAYAQSSDTTAGPTGSATSAPVGASSPTVTSPSPADASSGASSSATPSTATSPAATSGTSAQAKDPFVERREARKQAKDDYKANKKAAKAEYKADKKSAKENYKAEKQSADANLSGVRPTESAVQHDTHGSTSGK
jgi:hypothetical protein